MPGLGDVAARERDPALLDGSSARPAPRSARSGRCPAPRPARRSPRRAPRSYTSSTSTWPASSTTVTPSTPRIDLGARRRRRPSRCSASPAGRPSARRARRRTSPELASPTTLPRRITVIRSATARTSRSLWVMKTIDVPAALQRPHDVHQVVGLLRGEHRGRLVEDQHLRVADQRLDDLDPLLDADRQVLRQRVDRHLEPVALGDLLDLAAAPCCGRGSRTPGRSWPSIDVLGDGEHRDQHEVLVHHADARGHRVAGPARTSPAGRRPGSRPRRAGTARRARSSGCSCRRRSRRAGRGSRRARRRGRWRRWRSACRSAS